MSGAPDTMPVGTMSGTPQVLLAHHLKQLKRIPPPSAAWAGDGLLEIAIG